MEQLKLLRYQFIRRLAERTDRAGKPIPFSIEYICLDGNVMREEQVITTSVNVRRKRRNIRIMSSGETRTIRDVLVTRINDTKIVVQ